MARLGDATWHKKEWLTLSHMGGMIPWLILSHVGYDVIKRKRNKKKKKENGKPHIWLEEGGGNFLLLTHTVNAPKRRREMQREGRNKNKEKERKAKRKEKKGGRNKKKNNS